MWTQPATPKQLAALQAGGNHDGKYYSKARASRTIGGAMAAGGSASGIAVASHSGARMSWVDTTAVAQREQRSGQGFDVSRDARPQSQLFEEKRDEKSEVGEAPALQLSMSVYDSVLPFAFLIDLEHRNVDRLEEYFGVQSPDHVRQQITAWSQTKIAVARQWMQGHSDIVAILRLAPVGTFTDLEVAARTLLLEAFPADLEESNVRRLESQFGVQAPDHVRQQAKGWVASRVEVATANAEFLVEVAAARSPQPTPPAIGAPPMPDEHHAVVRPSNVAGAQHRGSVIGLNPNGATVEIAPGITGWLHISKLRPLAGGRHVKSVAEHLRLSQKIDVREIGTDERGRLMLALVIIRSPGGGRDDPHEPEAGCPRGQGQPARYIEQWASKPQGEGQGKQHEQH
ncbi:hypothetical protein [Cryobacterium sp. Hh38]|uniref:hypothetical protein n=1 Tax=Cryobacterium sp. Hh38 TaxID=1259156 RepID=UPI00141AA4D5|nr:hypothetical protein [Cryobacterium sp. Hh38]